VARHDETRVSVASLAEPGEERAAAATYLLPMLCAVVVHVIQCEKLDVVLTAADAARDSFAVMKQRRQSILAKARLAMLVVTDLAPRV
jgi:hypothetical protein